MGEIHVLVAAPGEVEADVLAVAVPEPAALTGPAATLDRELDGQLSDLVDSGEIRGNRDSATIVHAGAGGAKRVAVAGLGKPEELNADSVRPPRRRSPDAPPSGARSPGSSTTRYRSTCPSRLVRSLTA